MTRLVSTLALLALLATPAAAEAFVDRTFTYDVVALLDEGKQVEGSAELAMEWGLYTYRFSVAQNQAKFINDPERYAVQYGGSCARMRPLSGEGDPTIHGVDVIIQAQWTWRIAMSPGPGIHSFSSGFSSRTCSSAIRYALQCRGLVRPTKLLDSIHANRGVCCSRYDGALRLSQPRCADVLHPHGTGLARSGVRA